MKKLSILGLLGIGLGWVLETGAIDASDLVEIRDYSVQSGLLRIGNRTPAPLRVVVLLRSEAPRQVYWDFAPGEGGEAGLLLSLGSTPLQIGPQDVLMAFTLDGTGRYWGPMVVGESTYPGWDPQQQLWVLSFPPDFLATHEQIITRPAPSQRDPSTSLPLADQIGFFRAGNRTTHPVRFVVMLRGSDPQIIHWDFAPGEGGAEGLPLSTGTEPLQLKPGDITLAFSLDGSRRYWGPNVVGESSSPFWDPSRQDWSGILQP